MKYVIYRKSLEGEDIAALFDRKDENTFQEGLIKSSGYVTFDIVCGEINPRCYSTTGQQLKHHAYDEAIILESMSRR